MFPRLLILAAAFGATFHAEPTQVAIDPAMEVCGRVHAVIRGVPARCDATLMISVGDATWGVIVPRHIRQQLLDPLEGATVCASGSLRPVNDRQAKHFGTTLMLRVRSASAIRVTSAVPPSSVFPPAGVVDACHTVVKPPQRIEERAPQYPSEALRERVEGVVYLDAIVDATGAVSDVRVSRSLDPRVDQAAIDAVRRWRFTPGTHDGQPIPVLISVQMRFVLGTRR